MHELPEALLTRVRQYSHYQAVDYDRLAARFGAELVTRRLEAQMRIYDLKEHRAAHRLKRWMRPLYLGGVRNGLRLTGQLTRAQQLARRPELIIRTESFAHLPPGFDGYRILQLSDFHFDYTPEMPEIVGRALEGLDFDLCVLTGDYRGEDYGPYEASLLALERTRPVLGDAVYAILGNHDNLELMLRFPEMDIHGLLNEGVWLERGGARIFLGGIDDPHYYRTHDMSRMRPQVGEAAFSILLAHSPEVFREAASAAFDWMLSGHTHGGQICLPGGFPLIAHAPRTPRSMIAGAWRYQHLRGYTSRGVGTSSVDCRLHCRPEITLHELRCSDG